MLQQVYQLILAVADALLGWLLVLPRDAVIVIVALSTACVLTLVRIFTSNQNLLERCAEDKKTLKSRIKKVKRQDHTKEAADAVAAAQNELNAHGLDLTDKDIGRLKSDLAGAVKRARKSRLEEARQMVALKSLKQEALPLLAAILPVALLATWCFARLSYHPPRPEEPVQVVAHFPISEAGGTVHLVPQPDMQTEQGWIKEIQAVTDAPQPYGRATWTLRADARPEPYPLILRYEDGEYRHELLVGQETYSEPISLQRPGSREHAVELKLRPFKPFGVIPRLPWIGLAPWLVAYLLITIPFVPLLKRLFGIY
jgi:hypothetical protein